LEQGKSKKVVVVAKGEKVKEAQTAGADEAGDADIIEKISKGWMDFDVLVATPDAMRDLTKLAKTLGPKGLMPNPKAGTVTFDIARTVKELKAGRIEFKMDSTAIVHSILGKPLSPRTSWPETPGRFWKPLKRQTVHGQGDIYSEHFFKIARESGSPKFNPVESEHRIRARVYDFLWRLWCLSGLESGRG
jgi:ribosomal protein L1